MRNDKAAQVTIRNLNKLSNKERSELVGWLTDIAHEILELNEIVEPTMRPKYSPVCHWSLMY